MSQAMSIPWEVVINTDGTIVPNAKLYTYKAGTTNAQAVYQDGALTTPHANPVLADAYGAFPPIFLDPTGFDYKFVLTDSSGVQIPSRSVDNYPASFLTTSQIGKSIYPQTTAELNVTVTPVNYQYRPGDLRRYGAAGDGATDDTTAITNALKTGQRTYGGGAQFTYRYNTTVLVPQGTLIDFDGEGCTLKPAGSAQIANLNATIVLGTTVTAGLTQGSVQLTLASVAGVAIGQMAVLSDATNTFPTYFARIKGLAGSVITVDQPCPFTTAIVPTCNVYAIGGATGLVSHIFWKNCTFDGSLTTGASASSGQCVRFVTAMSVIVSNVEVKNFACAVASTGFYVLFQIYTCDQATVTECNWHDNILPSNTTSNACSINTCNQGVFNDNVVNGMHFGCDITLCAQASATGNVMRGNRTFELQQAYAFPYSVRGIKFTGCGTAQLVGNQLDDYANPIRVDTGWRTIVSGNSCRNSGWAVTNTTDVAINISAANDTNMVGTTIIGNVIENSGGVAIQVNNGAGATVQCRAIIQGNIVRRCNSYAIYAPQAGVTVRNNVIEDWNLANIGAQAVNYGDGATIIGNQFLNVTVAYICLGTNFVATYQYCIDQNTSPTGNPIFSGLAAGLSGLEAGGTGTIASGSTNVTITHNQVKTPTIDEITIIPSANTTASVDWWYVNTIGATSFQVNVLVNPGAGGFNFGWRVKAKQPWTA